jgi:hypothetical protein
MLGKTIVLSGAASQSAWRIANVCGPSGMACRRLFLVRSPGITHQPVFRSTSDRRHVEHLGAPLPIGTGGSMRRRGKSRRDRGRHWRRGPGQLAAERNPRKRHKTGPQDRSPVPSRLRKARARANFAGFSKECRRSQTAWRTTESAANSSPQPIP